MVVRRWRRGNRPGELGAVAVSAAQSRASAARTDRVAILEHALWRQLAEAEQITSRAPAWAALAAELIPNARQTVIVLKGTGGFVPATLWPAGDRPSDLLMAAVETALEQKTGAVRLGRVPGPHREAAIALPLLAGSDARGAVAVSLAGADEDTLRAAMRHLRWGAGWLHAAQSGADASAPREALALLGAAIEETAFLPAAQRLVTELASRFDCDRVSLGLLRSNTVRVVAISHSASVETRGGDAGLLSEAMAEAADQRAILRFPPTQEDAREPLARIAQERLAGPTGAVLTIPLVQQDRVIGALALEHARERPMGMADVALLDVLSGMAGPVLWDKWREDRWLAVKAVESVTRQLRLTLGPTHTGRKLLLLAMLAACVVAGTWRGDYQITAQARLEGSVQRSVVSDLDGFLRSAPVRAGDTVHAGEVLATLDDRDLALERLRWSTERQQRQAELDQAIGEQKRAETKVLRAELDQADAQLALADMQLARTRITAPFDALVVSGDHSQAIGGPVRRGDALFELAPLNQWRVVLDVEEAQIADAQTGQRGRLVLTAMPYQSLDFTVTRITPVARLEDGHAVFRVEATLGENSPRLRPGMQGIGRIDAGRRKMLWIWTRRLVEQARLLVWQVVP